MAGSSWVPTVDDTKVKEGRYVAVYPKGLGVLLVRQEGDLFAVANRCAHMGCPLEGGKLDHFTIECPCHDWRFDVRDGEFIDAAEITIPTYAVKIEEGKVLVRLEDV